MKNKMREEILKEMMDSVEDQVDSDIDTEEDEIEESSVKLSPVAQLQAKRIEDKIRKQAEEDGELEKVKNTIERNKERQAQALAAKKASDFEARLGGKIFADSKQFRGLNVVKENYIKHLRTLLENEVEQAGVLMAAKGFSQDIQSMIEKMGRLMNEELGPVVDNMRMAYGAQQSEAFAQAMRSDMQSIMDNLLTVKDNIDDAVDELAAGQIPNMDNDMDGDMDADDVQSSENDFDAQLQMPDEIGDDFGGDESASGPVEEPLGRPQKESIEQRKLKKKLQEMKVQIAALKKLKEKSAK